MPLSLPTSLQVGLKEWDVVCRALARGRQILLLRKGGIYEASSGFELEHNQFLLFPTFVHQNLASLKSEVHADFSPQSQEPEMVNLSVAAVASDIVRLTDRAQMAALDDQHIWASPLIDMRFNYRPDNPLYLLLVRVYALWSPMVLKNTPAYAGCKSWVPLEQATATTGAKPVLDDASYEQRRNFILGRL
jgi:hypothetical protein